MKKKWLALAAACLSSAVPAWSAPLVADGAWDVFDIDPLSATSGGDEWIALDGSALSFDVALAAPARLDVVDAGFAGDRFEVFDNGVSLGWTSASASSYPASIGLDFDAAFAAATYSRGSFELGPGSHSITGMLVASALDDTGSAIDATVGALRLAPVPEPSTTALMLGGCIAMGLALRRRA
jgi:hypothetical protein